MVGLLRKYKISKISDNVKLNERELEICDFFNNRLSGLYNTTYNTNKQKIFYTSDNKIIFRYNIDSNTILVNSTFSYDIENSLKIYFFDIEVRILIKEIIESLYGLHITNVKYVGRELESVLV